jgi:hypothetical protein
MPQRYNQKTVNNFVKGLITEAGEMTFPDGASVDELNCELKRDGSRRRRLGVSKEQFFANSTFTVSSTEKVNSGAWTNVAGISGLEFLVIQKGYSLYFYNKAELPYSNTQKSFNINLQTYEHTGSAGAENYKCQFASLQGYLVVSSGGIETIYIKYTESTDSISVSTISHRVRDFEWQGEKDTYDETASLALAPDKAAWREYDSYNSAWSGTDGKTAYDNWITNESSYPPITHPWFSGKDTSNNYSRAEWKKVYSGTSIAGNGHFILDFFTKNRKQYIGNNTYLPDEVESSRFKSVAAFSGRIFYAGLESGQNSGAILFSKVIENEKDFGTCYQVNDPTAEYLSDLLATDGGVIQINSAVNIKLLYPFQTSLFVFAENGVWQVIGVDGIFSASAYALNKVSDVGIDSAQSFVSVESIPIWWSRYGIHTMQFDQVSGQASEQSISLPTIQSYWDDIPAASKSDCFGVYDSISKEIYWFYKTEDETNVNKYNEILVLDVALQAFYPWRISDQTSNTDYVAGVTFYPSFGAQELELNVITTAGDSVVTSSGDNVVSAQIRQFTRDTAAIVLLIVDGSTGYMTMGGFTDTSFYDWGDANYESYAETGYDFIGDAVLKKNAPYVAVYSRLTEEGFTFTGSSYEPIRPSSLLVTAAWDFDRDFPAGQQAYRLKYPVVVDEDNLDVYNYPESVITTRLKVRGHGRSMRVKFSSEEGKDFVLIGWSMIQAANTRF